MSIGAHKMLRSLAVMAVAILGSTIAIGTAVMPALAPAAFA
jgi:hypothetical protein